MGGQLRGQTVKVDAEAQHSRPVVRAKLRKERREDPRQDIPRAAFRQASVASRAARFTPVP